MCQVCSEYESGTLNEQDANLVAGMCISYAIQDGMSDNSVLKSTYSFFQEDWRWVPSSCIGWLTTSVTPALEDHMPRIHM